MHREAYILVDSQLANVCQDRGVGESSLGLTWESTLLQMCEEQGQG